MKPPKLAEVAVPTILFLTISAAVSFMCSTDFLKVKSISWKFSAGLVPAVLFRPDNLDTSTYLAVLQDERDLSAAESALVAAMTNYAKARVQLDKDTAQTLERNNIDLNQAVTGQITTLPNVPGTVPNKTALQETSTPAQQPPK